MLTNADGRQCFSYSNKSKSEVQTNIKNTDVGPTQQDKIYFLVFFGTLFISNNTGLCYNNSAHYIVLLYTTFNYITLPYTTLEVNYIKPCYTVLQFYFKVPITLSQFLFFSKVHSENKL